MFTTNYSPAGSGTAPAKIALDFSSLNSIKQAPTAQTRPEPPVESKIEPPPIPDTPKQENAPQRRTEREKSKAKGKADAFFLEAPEEPPKVDPEKEYLKARLQCSQLQAEILKQLRAGEDIYSLFLQAMKAISLLTGEDITYTVAEKELKAVYGYGLERPPVLQTLLDEAEARLNKLRAAEQEEINKDTDDYKRILGAIAAHERRTAYLRAKLGSGKS